MNLLGFHWLLVSFSVWGSLLITKHNLSDCCLFPTSYFFLSEIYVCNASIYFSYRQKRYRARMEKYWIMWSVNWYAFHDLYIFIQMYICIQMYTEQCSHKLSLVSAGRGRLSRCWGPHVLTSNGPKSYSSIPLTSSLRSGTPALLESLQQTDAVLCISVTLSTHSLFSKVTQVLYTGLATFISERQLVFYWYKCYDFYYHWSKQALLLICHDGWGLSQCLLAVSPSLQFWERWGCARSTILVQE